MSKYSRNPGATSPKHQSGIVLLVVVMIVFLMMTLLAFLVEDQHLLLRGVSNQNAAEQGYQYAEGINSWALYTLHADTQRDVDYAKEDWATLGQPTETSATSEEGFTLRRSSAAEDEEPPVTLDFGDVPIDVYITDLQGRFNLNNLATPEPSVRAGQKTIFINILEQVGVTDFDQRESLYAALYDWLDKNTEESPSGMESGSYASLPVPYYASDQPLSTLGELKYVNGFSAQLIADLSPFITVLPILNAQININSTTPEVLASLSSSPVYDAGTVTAFLTARDLPEFQGFNRTDISAAINAIMGVSVTGQPPVDGMLATASQYFQINVKVDLDSSLFCMRTKVFRDPLKANSDLAESMIVLGREYDTMCLMHEPPELSSNDSLP